MKLAKTISATGKRNPAARIAANVSAPVRRVNRARLDRLAGCWPAAEADRIALFISENCEIVNEGD